MIAGDDRATNFCIHSNEAHMSKRLPIIYPITEVPLCCFDLDGERGGFCCLHRSRKKKESPCVARRKVHVCRCKVMEAGGDGRKEDSVDVAVLQSEHVNQK